jgi:hypothetical protein
MNERTSDEADFQPTRHDTFALIGTRRRREVVLRQDLAPDRDRVGEVNLSFRPAKRSMPSMMR